MTDETSAAEEANKKIVLDEVSRALKEGLEQHPTEVRELVLRECAMGWRRNASEKQLRGVTVIVFDQHGTDMGSGSDFSDKREAGNSVEDSQRRRASDLAWYSALKRCCRSEVANAIDWHWSARYAVKEHLEKIGWSEKVAWIGHDED